METTDEPLELPHFYLPFIGLGLGLALGCLAMLAETLRKVQRLGGSGKKKGGTAANWFGDSKTLPR